jgi:hypothetical protein
MPIYHSPGSRRYVEGVPEADTSIATMEEHKDWVADPRKRLAWSIAAFSAMSGEPLTGAYNQVVLEELGPSFASRMRELHRVIDCQRRGVSSELPKPMKVSMNANVCPMWLWEKLRTLSHAEICAILNDVSDGKLNYMTGESVRQAVE